jgi:hypothetical protein
LAFHYSQTITKQAGPFLPHGSRHGRAAIGGADCRNAVLRWRKAGLRLRLRQEPT